MKIQVNEVQKRNSKMSLNNNYAVDDTQLHSVPVSMYGLTEPIFGQYSNIKLCV